VAATDTKREVRAEAKWVRISPRKARLVAEHIRGRSVPEARTVLAFTPRAAAREIEKVLRSAVANAEANHGLIGDDLVVSAAYIDEGPTIKRWRARARGRVNRIQKRTCHITIKVVQGERERRATATRPAAPAVSEEKPKRSRRKSAEPAVEATPVAEVTQEEVATTETAEAAAVAEAAGPEATEVDETEPEQAETDQVETEQAETEEKES
jgi:large subunit ribosomal protein L22